MTNKEFIEMLHKADRLKSLYVLGCFGAPAWKKNKDRWIKAQSYNARSDRKSKIEAASEDTFMYDCCGLVKGVINCWCGDTTHVYGGMTYQKNIPDTTILNMLNKYCDSISSDFSNIVPGEFLVYDKEGSHCGVYIGDGMCIECTPKWDDGVQITEVWNIKKTQSHGRTWWKHGKFKMIDYIIEEVKEEEEDVVKCPCCGKEIKVALTAVEVAAPAPAPAPAKKTNEELAREVIQGKWGNGQARKDALTKAGYDYSAVQKIVNELCK